MMMMMHNEKRVWRKFKKKTLQ